MSTKIKFLGAAGFVTGSQYLITHSKGKFLVDCGFYQGSSEVREHNYEDFRFNPEKIDFVLLTHAHLDHCGLLPKLYNHGFRGPVYSTPATKDLTKIVLTDAAHLQEHGAQEEDLVLFDTQDAKGIIEQIQTKPYGDKFELKDNITARLRDAGHILGSEMIEVWIDDMKIVFSGDIGNAPVPIMRDPEQIEGADFVICESTYGDRNHEHPDERFKGLKKVIKQADQDNGKILIPVFAIQRTQDVLYQLDKISEDPEMPNLSVFLDSPMAIESTKAYKKHYDLLDEEFKKHMQKDPDPLDFPNLAFTETAEESKKLKGKQGPMIILAGSGMADAGRIQHHLKNHLRHPTTKVVFVGFQVPGSPGRTLLDGADSLTIFGDEIKVNASIHNIEAFSAHADQEGLLDWLNGFETDPKVFLTHGDPDQRQALKQLAEKELGLDIDLPKLYEEYELKQ